MQQRIRFCSTADGVRIAYATVGTGPALLVALSGVSHLELEWEEPRVRDFWETIGQHHMVVRYDRHGCGLSDRNRTDFSLDSEIRTIEAIVKELGLKSFVLWGQRHGAAPAIGYAVKFPDRVSHLILCNAQRSMARRSCRGRRPQESRRLSRAGAVELADGLTGTGGDDARELVRCRFAAMVPPHPAGRRDGRNARSAVVTLW